MLQVDFSLTGRGFQPRAAKTPRWAAFARWGIPSFQKVGDFLISDLIYAGGLVFWSALGLGCWLWFHQPDFVRYAW